MSSPQPDSTRIYRLLETAFSIQEADSGKAKALLTAHVTACLLLSEKIDDLNLLIGALVEELQLVRLERSQRSSPRPQNSTSSPATSSRSAGASTTTGKPNGTGGH